MYSVVLMMAMTTGGNAADLGHRHGGCCGETAYCGHRHGGCCGETAHCGHRHHRGHGCCGESYGCSSCGSCGSYGCSSSGSCGSYGCASCASGFCSVAATDPSAAVIVVSLPADAKLTIDDQATASTSDQRVFVSPSLPAGTDFYYTLKAEISVNGKAQVVSQVVTVRAGEQSQVTLTAPTGVAER